MPSEPVSLRADTLSQASGVRHGFFSRRGGVSSGLFASLNCGYGSGDNAGNVTANRARAANAVGIDPGGIVTAYQVHSGLAVVVERPWAVGEGPQVDGMATAVGDIALGILTADCAPVLLADGEARVIGASHAGWRGAKEGVLEATLAAMVDLGAKRGNIVAGIGPCIAQASYEVGPEFPAPFFDEDDGNRAYFRPSARRDKYLFDLAAYVASRLRMAGVKAIETLARDTCAEADAFFSYRRATLSGEPDYGRNLSLIALAD